MMYIDLGLNVGHAPSFLEKRAAQFKRFLDNRRGARDGTLAMPEPCAPEAGRVAPIIDRTRCEAKEDCVRVCPYHVFEVRRLSATERQQLSWFARGKLFVHGGRQAFAVRAADCHACGLCVKACPENAIRLESVTA